MAESVAVIVPTYNAAATIAACLGSVQAQTRPADELIVVDGGSGDGTAEIAREQGARVITSQANRSAQRNAGAQAASSHYLLFIDADMVLDPGVIAECLAAFRSEHAAVVIPEVSVGTTFLARVKAFERSFYQGVWWMEAARWFRRSQFLQIGGYDTQLLGGEDWDLDERIRKFGGVGRVKSLIRHQEGTLRLTALREKKAHYGKALLVYVRLHPERARRQLGMISRIFIFLRHPLHLFRHPVLTAGLAYMGWQEVRAVRAGEESDNPWAEERAL